MTAIERLERNLSQSVRQLQIAESLLFLNKVLAVARGSLDDRETSMFLGQLDRDVPGFVVHLIVKYLMRHGRANTPNRLDWSNFPAILHHGFALAVADPISDSSDLQVLGSLVRMASQQLRRSIPAQNYGLAIGMFQDLDAVAGPKPIDLRREVEAALNMPIELFMRLGHAAHSAACATHGTARLPGTLNRNWLTKAASEIPSIPWLEGWAEVARIIAKDQKAFNATIPDRGADRYAPYRFTPLLRHPVIQIDTERFIAVDPWLLVERTSWGVFYDIFEKHQGSPNFRRFTESFGYAFEGFIGNLIRSVIAAIGFGGKRLLASLLRESRAGRAKHHTRWAIWQFRRVQFRF